MQVTAEAFKQTLRRFASGVTVVTMQHENDIHGITVSAFLSVSLEPPLVLVSIAKNARSHEKLFLAERYAVSILSQEQQRLSNHFAGWDKEIAPEFEYLAEFPVVKDALCHLVCRIHDKHDAGDHTLFIGQVEAVAWRNGEPLLYFDGNYREFQVLEKSV